MAGKWASQRYRANFLCDVQMREIGKMQRDNLREKTTNLDCTILVQFFTRARR